MAVVLMPLAGSHVIHPRWSEHHRPTATGTMTGECIVTRQATAGTTDAGGRFTSGSATTIYTGVCRVTPLIRPARVEVVGEAQETHRHYQVAVRYDTPEVQIGDLVDITIAVDAGLAGRKLRVIDVTYGTEQWQRDLLCDELED